MPKNSEIYHRYGAGVHILDDTMAASGLVRLSNANTGQHEVRRLTAALYREVLLRAIVNQVFQTSNVGTLTPMANVVGGRAMLRADIVDPSTHVTIATLLRAGDVPASACLDRLSGVLEQGSVRQDFFGAGRTTNEEHRVTGTDVSYMKTGAIHDRILIIPDPMGATGGTVVQTLNLYGPEQIAMSKAIVAAHLIITPEYIRRVTAAYPQLQVFALRLDRGMSDSDVLDSVPGTFPDREFGLTDTQYIVPGAGDLGFRLTGIP